MGLKRRHRDAEDTGAMRRVSKAVPAKRGSVPPGICRVDKLM